MRPRRPVRKLLVRGLLLTLGLVFIPYAASRLLSPWRMISRHTNPEGRAPGRDPAGTLRLVSYNIAHGRGDGPSSRNWTGESRDERVARLDQIAELLRTVDADVVVLNEVDFDTSWSKGINQAKELAARAGYRYWAEARNLDFRVLIWKWRFGNAVLSKHPIVRAEAIDLPGYSTLESLVAGKKRGAACNIDFGGRLVRIAGVHLCHRSEQVRAQSAELLSRMAAESASPFFVIGDLNSTPPDFQESPDNQPPLNAISVLDASGQFERLPVGKPSPSDMTFHSSDPQRVIDWILIPQDWEFRNYAVIQSNLSDHRLVSAEVAPSIERVGDTAAAPAPTERESSESGSAL